MIELVQTLRRRDMDAPKNRVRYVSHSRIAWIDESQRRPRSASLWERRPSSEMEAPSSTLTTIRRRYGIQFSFQPSLLFVVLTRKGPWELSHDKTSAEVDGVIRRDGTIDVPLEEIAKLEMPEVGLLEAMVARFRFLELNR